MFEYLYGTVEYKKMDYIAIDINGVGYRVYFPLREYEKIEVGNKYKFYIYFRLYDNIIQRYSLRYWYFINNISDYKYITGILYSFFRISNYPFFLGMDFSFILNTLFRFYSLFNAWEAYL